MVRKALYTLFIFCVISLSYCTAQAEWPELLAVIKSDSTYTGFGKRIMPLGDQNGDGYDDIMVADLLGRAYYFRGREFSDTIYAYELRYENIVSSMNNIGDINGDGSDDFLLPGKSTTNKKLSLFYGGTSLGIERDAWFGIDNLYGRGFSAAGFDFNANGTTEIVSWSSQGASALFYEMGQPIDSVHDLRLTPANLNYAIDYSWFGRNPIVGHFNGDSIPDLALGLKRRLASGIRGAVYFYWGGENFDSIPDLIVKRPVDYVCGSESFAGALLEDIGDINNDGYGDIFTSASADCEDSLGFVFFGGPDLDSIPELIINNWHSVARTAGDVNNDGVDDFILGHPLPFSGSGEVYIHYGGTDMDSIPDITFTNRDMPGYQVEFGFDCSGVGDFNGDGIDDFAFSLQELFGYGLVLIYSGVDMSTSVDIEHDPEIPESFLMLQNYPNPFNPTTTIEFALPIQSDVSLRVYNVLGKEVKRLIDRSMGAGTYSVVWDAKDSFDRPLASGIYLYRLTTGENSITRKMILMK